LREIPWGHDGSYSPEAIRNRVNAELANDLGNLAQRSLSMVAKNLDGVLPSPGPLGDGEAALLALADAMIGKARAAMEDFAIHLVLAETSAVVAEANRAFAAAEPWALRKTDPERFGTVLWTTAEVIRQVAILLQPAIPEAAGKLLDQLAVPMEARDFAHLGSAGRLKGGGGLPAPQGVFPRIQAEETPA
jgi:methionyl-tRNA synthetase